MKFSVLSADSSIGKKLVVSMAAGLDTAKLEDWFGDYYRVVRAMPNTPVEASSSPFNANNKEALAIKIRQS